MAIEDIINQALVEAGSRRRIADIYEGTDVSIAALEIYAQTRDELLDAGEWPLARRSNVTLTLLKGPPPPGGYNPATPWAPTYPPPGWLYEYAYPDDMLDLRSVSWPPMLMFDLDPRPAVFRIDNDNSLVDNAGAATTQKKVILTNVAGAIATYIGQVTEPGLWEPGFTRSLVEKLAKRLGRRLGLGEEAVRDIAAEGAVAAAQAERSRG